MRRLLTTLCLSLLAASCISTTPVSLSSDPAGAAVYVNGAHSGFTTPCVISLDKDENYEIAIELNGYQRAERFIVYDPGYETLLWREMAVVPRVWRFPLWLNLEDFFTPVKRTYLLKPSRIFVRMQRSADQ